MKKENNMQKTIKKLSRQEIGPIPYKRIEKTKKDKLKNRQQKHKKIDYED
ncbi:hypothetical protein GW796_05880 [archaeon]|nr:hypothetical protein [archaeon]NCQ51413.1 hypothetical protein [archaeon]NCT58761.1 hypothetical protein [archaeon]